MPSKSIRLNMDDTRHMQHLSKLNVIDPDRFGPLGPKIVQLMEDNNFWLTLCPQLHVESAESKALCQSDCTFHDKYISLLQNTLAEDGMCSLLSSEFPWAADSTSLDLLAEGLKNLVAAGWPPSFIWVFDEAWIMTAQVRALLQKISGNDTCFDFLAFCIEPGGSGFSPHRDRPLGGFKSKPPVSDSDGFHSNGLPKYVTAWIPLVDVPVTSSCLACVPAYLDDGYKTEDASCEDLNFELSDFQKVRNLPCMKGDALIFSHRLFHWSKASSTGKRGLQRLSLSFVHADDEFEDARLSRHWLPLPPLQLRVALAAGQTLDYGFRINYGKDMTNLCWLCFLACIEHFDQTFARSVNKMKTALLRQSSGSESRCGQRSNETRIDNPLKE